MDSDIDHHSILRSRDGDLGLGFYLLDHQRHEHLIIPSLEAIELATLMGSEIVKGVHLLRL